MRLTATRNGLRRTIFGSGGLGLNAYIHSNSFAYTQICVDMILFCFVLYMSTSMSDLGVIDEYVCVNNVGELKPI